MSREAGDSGGNSGPMQMGLREETWTSSTCITDAACCVVGSRLQARSSSGYDPSERGRDLEIKFYSAYANAGEAVESHLVC